jgi:hypothetical protein
MMSWVGRFDAEYLWARLHGQHVNNNQLSDEVRIMTGDFPNSGIMFKNDRQRSDSKDPDRTGSADLTCPHCQKRFQTFVSGWLKTGRSGAKFLSLSFRPKDSAPATAAASTADNDDLDW